MTALTFGERFLKWAAGEPAICLVALIGSRARTSGEMQADEHSDWDFHVATTCPEIFKNGCWLAELGLTPLVYVERRGRLGTTRKVTAIFPDADVDWVILPADEFRACIEPAMTGLDRAPPSVQDTVINLAMVLQGGYRIFKGTAEFESFYGFVSTQLRAGRLSDDALCSLADGFVCDYISTLRKIVRGEFQAARRWVHHQLLEVNFRLLHELRLREGLPSLPDARRIEFLHESRVEGFKMDVLLTRESLWAGAENAALTCRDLMRALVGVRWRWPNLTQLGLKLA
jgi:hypothetical protein